MLFFTLSLYNSRILHAAPINPSYVTQEQCSITTWQTSQSGTLNIHASIQSSVIDKPNDTLNLTLINLITNTFKAGVWEELSPRPPFTKGVAWTNGHQGNNKQRRNRLKPPLTHGVPIERHWRSRSQTSLCRCVAAKLVYPAMTNVLLSRFGEARISANALISCRTVSSLVGPVKALGTTTTKGSLQSGSQWD